MPSLQRDSRFGGGGSAWSGRRAIALFTLIFIAVGLTWRVVRYALGFPIWGDEAFVAINLLHRDWAGLTRPLEYGQFAPLLFMWLERASVLAWGVNEYSLRQVAFLCGMLSPVLFLLFARRTLDARSALLAVGIFCASYYPVRHAAEVKPYSGDLLLALVVLSAARSAAQQPALQRHWLALAAAAAVGPWFSYPVVLVGGAAGVFLLVHAWQRRSARMLAAVGTYGAVLCASFLIMYLVYARPQRTAAEWITEIPTWQAAFPPVSEPWRLPWWFLIIHTGNMMAYPFGGHRGGSTLTFLLVAAGVVETWKRDRTLLWLLLGPLPLLFVAAALQKYPYGSSARVSLFMAPAFCWLAGAGLMGLLKRFLQPRAVPRALAVSAGALLMVAAVGLARDIARPRKTDADGENRRVIRDLSRRAAPGERWIIYNRPGEGAHGNFLGHTGGYGARFRFYVELLAPGPVLWAPDPSAVDASAGGRTWFLVYENDRFKAAVTREPQFGDYLGKLIARLGLIEQRQNVLDAHERIHVYTLGKTRP